MNTPIADWTTAGPYHSLSWLTLAYTALAIVALILLILETIDAVQTRRAVSRAQQNGALEIVTTSSFLRSMGRLGMVICFCVIAFGAVYVNIQETPTVREMYWYRNLFIGSFMLSEILIILIAINDLVARRKLFYLIDQRYESHD